MPLSEEYRVFIYAGRILNIQDYWTEKAEVKITDEEKHWLEEIAHKVKSNFVTVDIARKANGSFVILSLATGRFLDYSKWMQWISMKHFIPK